MKNEGWTVFQDQTTKITKDCTTTLHTMEDKKIFLEAILNPPAPNEALKNGHLNYLKFRQNPEHVNI